MAIHKAEQQRDFKAKGNAMYLLGLNLSLEGQVDSALGVFNHCLAIYNKVNYCEGQAKSLLQLGEVYYNWGSYDKALDYFLKAMTLSKQNNLPNLEAVAPCLHWQILSFGGQL
ncbi:MAG: tetratricopeptide repeat protein [Bacteroidales bacterium]|nr:tetratricopeptide repeat protein [Bacteroidales bacterium]